MAYNRRMPARVKALIALLLAGVMLGGWYLKHRRDVNEREHAAALERTLREPGVLVADPALSPGIIAVELIPAGPTIDLPTPASIRLGQQTRLWSPGTRARFEERPGQRGIRVSVTGDYIAESAWLDVPLNGSGARVALRAIPIDPPMVGPPGEKQLEISSPNPSDIVIVWKQSSIVVSEIKVPRATPRDALAAAIQKEWAIQGSHRDPADRKFDRAIIRVEPGASFFDIFPLLDALLATRRTVSKDGEIRPVPAFYVSVQPVIPLPRPGPDRDVVRPRAADVE